MPVASRFAGTDVADVSRVPLPRPLMIRRDFARSR